MKLVSEPSFLTKGTASTGNGEWRGVALHPSSEVDLCIIGGYVLSVGAVVPLAPGSHEVKPVRGAPTNIEVDGDKLLGDQQLVLQLYEKCDALIPPGPRVSTIRQARIPAANIGANAAAATLALRVPFSGRKQARVSFKRKTNNKDLNLQLVAVNFGKRGAASLLSGTGGGGGLSGGTIGGHLVEGAIEAWFNGGVAGDVQCTLGALQQDPEAMARFLNFGGEGDAAEVCDELLVYVFGDADANNDAIISVEARD